MQMNELNHLMNQAKVALMMNKKLAFFTTILFSLKFEWDDTYQTAWVDGYKMGWNPQWFHSLTPGGRLFVMAHEACHVAIDHLGRILGRNKRLWNWACDYVINLMLKDMGLEMPNVGLIDERFRGMSAEQVYAILEEEQKNGQPPPVASDFGDDMREPMDDKGDPVPQKELQQHIEQLIMRAAIQATMDAKNPGHIPGDVQLFLDRLMKPKLPWKQILRREVGTYAKSGYSWMKPNRRFYPDFILPSKWGKAPDTLRFYVDISGSVEDYQFNVFVSEIASVMKMFTPRKVTIIQFDDVIQSTHEVRSLRELSQIKFKGRGGTEIEPVFEDIEKHKPDLAMIFTDGGFDWYEDLECKQRLIWLINDNPGWKAVQGKTIHFKTKDMR